MASLSNKGLTLDPEISDVLFENITVLYNFHKPVISIHNSDDAYVHDIVYRSILVENAFMQGDNGNNKELIEMTLQNSAWSTVKDEFGSIDNVLIDGLTVLNTTNGKVPASRLSGQTYKGAIFWDTEMFMLDFSLACIPEVAKHCLEYRIETLPGALEKAKFYGYAGAFYAWESVEGGKGACTDYNVTDVFTGRPMRTFFRDTQIHISAAVVYGLRKYTAYTGDDSLLRSGGAQVVLECARFYMSLMSKRILSSTYDLLDVMGPDEYHEHVNNNAYTNEMARMTLRYAVEVCRLYLPDTTVQELDAFLDAAEHLKHQTLNPKTGVIKQFDGYFKLEDVPVPQVRSRLLDPREYWDGAYGVASQTQVVKQPGVMALLYMLGQYPASVIAANYDYYEPRTEPGSSLSACMYSLCACAINRPDVAYPLFLKSAEADIQGGGNNGPGVYISGTHPAAAGGAYMVLLYGFLGLHFEVGQPVLSPRLPKGWKRVKLHLHWQGRDWLLDTQR